MPRLEVRSLPDGVLLLQSELWATNTTLVRGPGGCLLCDPSIFSDELDEIRRHVDPLGPVHLLVTHSDFDHVCGIPAFPNATVVTGATTAAAIADGTARRKLDESAIEWGTTWDGELRVDVVLGDQPERFGGLEVLALPADGHIEDGSAFVVRDRGLLLPGDYLSVACYPVLVGTLEGALVATERLLAALDAHEISLVIPGHGPPLTRDEARLIAREDIAYIRSLQKTAAAVHDHQSANAAFLSVYSVEPPRLARTDFEAFGLRAANARQALFEAGYARVPGMWVD